MREKEKLAYLETLLFETYHLRRASEELPEGWREKVMREIRNIRLNESTNQTFLERWFGNPILFRFAGVCLPCALSLMLFFILTGGVSLGLDRLVIGNPAGIATLAVFVP